MAFGKTARGVMFGALIIAPVFVSSIAVAKTVNFESLEVEESQGQAVMAIDIPPGGVVEPEQFANRNELVLTFHGVPTTTARRVHSGGTAALFQSVDVEPWYEDGEQQTRMVVHYSAGSQVSYSREGDILVVTVFDSGEGSSAEWAATPDSFVSSDAYVNAPTDAPIEGTAWSSDAATAAGSAIEESADEARELVADATNTVETPAVDTSWDSPAPAAEIVASDAYTESSTEVARYEWDVPESDAYADDAYSSDAGDSPGSYSASGYVYDESSGTYTYVGDESTIETTGEPVIESGDGPSVGNEVYATSGTASENATWAEPATEYATDAYVADAADEAESYATEATEVAEVAQVTEVAEPSNETAQWEAPAVTTERPADGGHGAWDDAASEWGDVNDRAWDMSETMVSARQEETSGTPVVAGLARAVTVTSRGTFPADTQPTVLAQDSRNLDDPPMISLDVQGADIHTVIRSIAESAGANIVANSDVKGKVTIKLDDIAWRRALGIVLRTQSLGSVEELGVIRVASEQMLRQQDIERQTAHKKTEELVALETAVVPVSFASAPELASALAGRLSLRGALDVDPRTNSLIVTDVPKNIPVITDLVQLLDTRTPQVEIVAKLVDLDMSAVRDLGVDWFVGNIHSTSEAISASGGVDATIASPVGTVNFGVIRDFADLDLTLQALETTQRANIISTPKITTVNNREARVLVGQEIPLITLDEAGNAITELKKIGIELKVTPYINQGDMITLDLHPMVSDLASQSTQQGGVIINTSEADTRVMVRDGETAVIGGLIRTNKTKFSREVPVLGKIPILGALFRTTTDSDVKRELVIFVTPRVIR